MRHLFHFIIAHFAWVLFVTYATLACMMLASSNPYHHHLWLTSAGRVAASIHHARNSVSSYIALRAINSDLQRQNAELLSENIALRHDLRQMILNIEGDSLTPPEPLEQFSFIIADVINNSVAQPFNYITVEKGTLDGVLPEMGVIDQNGVVGVVNLASDHYARIISLLNPNFRLSCKIKGTDTFGSLVWDGRSPSQALLEELPTHTVCQPGDTIVTSGYSSTFPEGIPVGTVHSTARDSHDDNFFKLRIDLLTDFTRLSAVRIINNSRAPEILTLERESTLPVKQ